MERVEERDEREEGMLVVERAGVEERLQVEEEVTDSLLVDWVEGSKNRHRHHLVVVGMALVMVEGLELG